MTTKNHEPAKDNLLDCKQVAVMLRFHPETVARLCREGFLPAHKVRRRWLFIECEIVAWVSSKKTTR
jgi:excisionase family DNA binding protein